MTLSESFGRTSTETSRTRRVVEGISASYLAFPIKAGIKLLVTPFYLARLGPELLGFNSFISEIMSYFQLMDAGVGTGLSAIVSKEDQTKRTDEDEARLNKTLRAGAQIQFIFAVIVFLSSLLLAAVLDEIVQGLPAQHLGMARGCTVIFGVAFSLMLVSGAYKAVLVGKQLIKVNVILSTISAVLAAIVGVLLVSAGWLLYGLAVAAFMGACVFFVQTRVRCSRLGFVIHPLKRPLETDAMKDLVSLSSWILLASLGGLLSLNSARIILGLTPSQGMESVTRFALLLAVPSMIRLQANRISVVVRPGLTQLANSENSADRVQRVSRLLVKSTGLLGAVAFAGVLLVNPAFVVRWVGVDYYAGDLENLLAAIVIGLSIWIFGFKVLMEVQFAFRQRGIGFLIGGMVTAVASIALAHDYGVAGVLSAAIFGEVVAAAIWFVPPNMSWLLRRGIGVQDALSLVWLPVTLVFFSVFCAVTFSPVPASWGWIIVSSLAVLIVTGVPGMMWLKPDLEVFLRNRRSIQN